MRVAIRINARIRKSPRAFVSVKNAVLENWCLLNRQFCTLTHLRISTFVA